MATDFTQDTVLHFLQSSGGSVKNSDLLLHFRNFIRNHADQERNRELFKKFVNSVATVRQEDGVSYVVLRKKYKGNVPGSAGGAWPLNAPLGDTTKAISTSSPCIVDPPPPPKVSLPPQGAPRQFRHRKSYKSAVSCDEDEEEEEEVSRRGPAAAAGGGGGGRAVRFNESDVCSCHQSLVPLEPREHTWLVKGAAGAWPDIYSLFREDSSLLNKRDFISGFTVLHWIAKHGDHRVLNTLWYVYFALSHSLLLFFDINARSTCGHTPLHIAAIHGNKNIMRLLVNKFSADVRLRDTAGKRPWQYLSHTAPVEIFHLLGAPARAAMGGDGGVRRVDTSWEQQQQQHRRRRHHLSSASGERDKENSKLNSRKSMLSTVLAPSDFKKPSNKCPVKESWLKLSSLVGV
uniref:SOWAHA-C winged helix-turn-helix domain-containing protein n=1 Tax=Lates calcarifer TaxID=8187 RepID=A0A4W6D6L0_LATCA